MRYAFAQATASHGQIVGVMGEPGVGKSRLFYEFKLTTPSGCLTLEAFSVSYGKASPYLPVIELLKTYFQITPQDDDRSRREKVLGKVLALRLAADKARQSPTGRDLQARPQRTYAQHLIDKERLIHPFHLRLS